MYHQFKELADVDITAEPMEVGPTCHYVMGGVEVDPDTAAAAVPGLFAAGEVSGGMHGSNRLGGNSLSDLLVFGTAGRPRRGASTSTRSAPPGRRSPTRDVDGAPPGGRWRRSPASGGENPYTIHADLQQTMNDLVGIIRTRRRRSSRRSTKLEDAQGRAAQGHRRGRPAVQPRLAPRARPAQHAPGLRVRRAGGADPRGVARRPHPRRLPGDEPGVAQGQPDLPTGRSTASR